MENNSDPFNSGDFLQLLKVAIEEDIGTGDITSLSIIEPNLKARGQLLAKEDLVVCGLTAVKRVLQYLNPKTTFIFHKNDGDFCPANTFFGEVFGDARTLLAGERVALNFIQRLSGVATKTRHWANKIKPITLLDTRKTTPGWRKLEKYAVKIGGGSNHRIGLFDQILIKNNHIDLNDSNIITAVKECRLKYQTKFVIEVEVRNKAELLDALATDCEIIMLDNMTPLQIKDSVALAKANRKVKIEISGGINETNIDDFIIEGVDYISSGALTHSVKAMDISLRINKVI